MVHIWHREEPRDVRPFFVTAQAEDALIDTGIQLFAGRDVSTDTSFELDEIDFQKLQPVIHISLADPGHWMPKGLSKGDLELVLIARHSFLKQSTIVEQVALDDTLPAVWPIPAELLDGLGGGRNVQLTLALCLATDRTPAPGSPYVPGHWLARKSFLLRSRTMPALFDLRTRTDEEWLAAHYPPKTFFAVEYAGGIEGELEEGGSVATVYIHLDAHNKMVNTPLGSSMQPILATEIILSIILSSFDDWKNLDVAISASPLATLLRQLGREEPMTLEDLKKLVARPSHLRGLLQDRLSVVSTL